MRRILRVRRRSLKAVIIAGTLIALSLELFSQNNAIEGKWEWKGHNGWQRLMLDLREDDGELTGTLTAGPGIGAGVDPADYWEYFFNPPVFKIARGRVRGNTFSFDHGSLTAVEHNVIDQAQKREMRVRYTGTVEGDRLYLKREIRQGWPFQLRFRNSRHDVVLHRYPSREVSGAEVQETSTLRIPPASTTYIAVTDRLGKPVSGLTSQDFQVREGSDEVRTVTSPDAPWNIQVLVDVDAWLLSPNSYSGNPLLASRGEDAAAETWNKLGKALSPLYNSLRSQDRLRMDTFFDQIDKLIDWTNGERKTPTVSLTTKPSGRGIGASPDKDIYGTIRKSVERFGSSSQNNLLIVLTDGRDGRLAPRALSNAQWLSALDPFDGIHDAGEYADFAQTVDAVQKSGVRVNILLVNADRPRPSFSPGIQYLREKSQAPDAEARLTANRMGVLAAATGGGVLYRGDTDQALAFLAGLPDLLRMRDTYRVEFTRGPGSLTTPRIIMKDPGLTAVQSEGGAFRGAR